MSYLNFEFKLLARMMQHYRFDVLRDLGMSDDETTHIEASCDFQIPQHLGSPIEKYRELIGPEVQIRQLGQDIPEVFRGSTEHLFLLMLWPHLYWVVNRQPNGQTWGAGFQNQAILDFPRLDPSIIRVGVWTRAAIEQLADRYKLYDGWDEEIVVHFTFKDQHYQGKFILGLLQDWQKL